jgi:vacuolar-type H+-ATPase subunit I/STV1
MIPAKVKEHLDEYINQEIYVQIAVIKGKEKGTTKSAIIKYLSSNHFKDLSKGKPYDHFIDGLKEKCLIKLSNSPMRNKETDDQVIKELQKKLNELSDEKLKDTYWEIETGEYLNGEQVNELEIERDKIIKKLNLENKEKKTDEIYETIISFCKKYEELCVKKYPEAPLPLEVLKSLN